MSITKAKRDKILNQIVTECKAEFYRAEIEAILKKNLAPGKTASSAKAKGRRAQQWLRDRLRTILKSVWYAELRDPDHVHSIGMGQSGADIVLSPTAKGVFPFACEVKNTEKIGFWPTVRQAEANRGNQLPLIMFAKNRTKPWIAVEAEVFLAMYGNLAQYLQSYGHMHHDNRLPDMLTELQDMIKEINEQIQKEKG